MLEQPDLETLVPEMFEQPDTAETTPDHDNIPLLGFLPYRTHVYPMSVTVLSDVVCNARSNRQRHYQICGKAGGFIDELMY